MIQGAARRYWLQWLVLGIGLLTLGALIGYALYREYRNADALERDRLQAQARVIDENLGRQLQGANDALAGVRKEFPPSLSKSAVTAASRHLKALSDSMPGVRTLLLVDAEGSVLAASRDELIGLNASEREYFTIPRERPDPAMLYVSRPFTTTLGVFSINVVRVVTGSRGEFSGIVSATLDPEYFSVLLNSVLYTPEMRSSIIHGDGGIVVEEPGRKDLAGMDLAKPGSRYTKHVASGKATNVFTGFAYSTGDERMSAWRTIRPTSLRMDKPLMVSVNRDMAGVFASWRRDVYVDGGLFGALLLVSSLSLVFFQRRQMAHDRLEAGYEIDRMRAMNQLRESEDRYRDLVEHSQQLICTHDLDGRILSVNPWAAKVLGYEQAELVSMNLRDFIAPKVRHEIDGYLATIRTNGSAQGLILVQPRSGEKRVWEFHNTLRTEGVPEPIVRGMAHDVTERNRAERELQHKTELAQLLEQLARAANEAVSPETAMETCLRRICENGKWVLGRVATFPPGTLHHKADCSQWYCAEPARFDTFMRFSDGYEFMGGPNVFINRVLREQRTVWLPDLSALDMAKFARLAMAMETGLKAAFAFPVVVTGEVAAFLEFFATETRKPDTQLIEGTTGLASQFARLIERGRASETQANLVAIVENSNEAIISRALDSTITSWNPAAERILGYTAAEVIGRNPVEIIPPELRQETAEWRELLKAGHTLQNIETVRITRDGRCINVVISLTATRDKNGGIIGTAVILRDITERKRAERILRDYTVRLQSISRKLLEVQEDERRRLARELHDQVGQVLTALKINLQVIERQPTAAPVASKIRECTEIADAALQQVRTLMLDLRPPQLDELGLAVAIRAHAERQLAPVKLALHFSAHAVPPRTPPAIDIVCFRILQEALTNILRHAGARNVWIGLAVDADGLTLTVRDDGNGFDLAETRRRAVRGGSFGLLSMEERAALADGRIEIITAPGTGTTVRAIFSLQTAQATVATA